MTARKKASVLPDILFHSDSTEPDMLYFSRFNSFDPYLAFSAGGRKFGVAPAMEYGRMRDESDFDEILLHSEVRAGAIRRFKLPDGKEPTMAQLVAHLAKEHKVRCFNVGPRFPAGLAFDLKAAGVKIEVARNGAFMPEREFKTASEVEALRKGNVASAAGFKIVAKTLKESKIRGGKLVHNGTFLTSERLRDLISQACLAEGAIALHTIASFGDQVVDNHCAGYGPILANELIIVDIFPRRADDGYWGDMTRTFLKGKASEAQRKLVHTVKKGHALSEKMIKPGVRGGALHEAVQALFVKEGYETVRDSTEPKGFFHALGHGIGLDVHEAPIMRAGSKWKFRKGQVITVEPGLYYRGLGGCRIEDVYHVVPGGCEKISSAPYRWEIP